MGSTVPPLLIRARALAALRRCLVSHIDSLCKVEAKDASCQFSCILMLLNCLLLVSINLPMLGSV